MSSHEASTPIHSAIPKTSVILAVLLFVAIEVAMHMLFIRNHDPLPLIARYLFILAVGLYIGSYALFSGYVYKDASRRGMPKVPWVLIVLVIPYGVGFLLFFLLRKPLLTPCIHCARGIGTEQAFCSFCGGPQKKAGVQPAWRIS